MAKVAAAKAAEVRKLKMEKQGVLGQINVIESKKKALVEIRQGVEERHQELFEQLEKDRVSEEHRIRIKSYSTVELGSDGKPTDAAYTRRQNQVIQSYKDLTNKFFADCDAVKASTATQDRALLAEIRSDQKSLTKTRTVSSMGDELKVSFGTYEGGKNGWNAYLSLYSDGVLLYTDNFIVGYEALSGKKAPDMETELRDSVIEEYANNVDMYNSLLTRGDPILYFEIDYSVKAENDDKPSGYEFNFDKIRTINTVSGETVQISTLAKTQPRTMKPEWNLREIVGIEIREKARFAPENYPVEVYMVKGLSRTESENIIERNKKISVFFGESKLVAIPNKGFSILTTEVTQKLYVTIMGVNPSKFKDEKNPVESVSLYDAIYFCNKLSSKFELNPVYSIENQTDVSKWNYIPHKGMSIKKEISQNLNANGFRLPTYEELKFAAEGGQSYKFAGSDELDEVAWYAENCGYKTHPVGKKKVNGYGLYDMLGNVSEWVWASPNRDNCCGGSWETPGIFMYSWGHQHEDPEWQKSRYGFRIIRKNDDK